MNNSKPTAPDIARLRAAADWVQRLNESTAQSDVDHWQHWCDSDPLNMAAFRSMQQVWSGLSSMPADGWPAIGSPGRPRYSWRIALAASMVLLVGVTGWLLWGVAHDRIEMTPVGVTRHVALADGTQVDLAPGTSMKVHFTATRRQVTLARGQAFFSVAHVADQPFVVAAKGLTVTAGGTAFDVRIGPSDTVVTVSEGRILIAANTSTDSVPAHVGQRVSFTTTPRRWRISTLGPNAAGSWREGTLNFVGEPLVDVVGALNRYNTSPVEVAAAMQQTRFTGTVSPRDVRDWLKALEQIYAVEIVDRGIEGTLIRAREQNATS